MLAIIPDKLGLPLDLSLTLRASMVIENSNLLWVNFATTFVLILIESGLEKNTIPGWFHTLYLLPSFLDQIRV